MIRNGIALIIGVILAGTIAAFQGWFDFVKNPTEPIPGGEFPTQLIWVFEATERVITTPEVRDGKVFIRTTQAVYALDSETGHLLWKTDTPSDEHFAVRPVAATENTLLVSEARSSLAALSIKDGTLLWRRLPVAQMTVENSTGTPYIQEVNLDPIHIESMIAERNMAYVVRYDWRLTAYDLTNGDVVWESGYPTRTCFTVSSDSKLVYLAGDHNLYAFDAPTGEVKWSKDLGTFVGPMVFDGEVMYMVMDVGDYILQALETDTQSSLWKTNLPSSHAACENHLLLHQDIGFVANGKWLAAISTKDGKILWQSQIEDSALGRPSVLGDWILVRDRDTTLYMFEINTGSQVGNLQIQSNRTYSTFERDPAVAGDLLIVPFGDNRVFAYRP